MREIVMIPQEHISWLVDQKDSVLSLTEIRKKNLAIDRLLPTVMDPFHQPVLLDVVRRDLPRNLNVLQPIMLEELREAINQPWVRISIDGVKYGFGKQRVRSSRKSVTVYSTTSRCVKTEAF